MSEQLELLEVAKYLASLLQCQITSSPGEPELVINALKLLMPDAEDFFSQVQNLPDEEEQWNHIIQFIEDQVLEEGMQLGFQSLDTEQIIEIYKIVIQMVEEAIQEQDQHSDAHSQDDQQKDHQLNNHERPKEEQQISEGSVQNDELSHHEGSDREGQDNQTGSGEESDAEKKAERALNSRNQQSLNYLQNVRKEQMLKKNQSSKIQGPPQNNKEKEEKPPKTQKVKAHGQKKQSKKSHSKVQKDKTKQQEIYHHKGTSEINNHQKSTLRQEKSKNRPQSSIQTKSKINDTNLVNERQRNLDGKTSQSIRPKTAQKNQQHGRGSGVQKKKSEIISSKQNQVQNGKISPFHQQSLQEEVMITVAQTMNQHQKGKSYSKQGLKSNALMRDGKTTEIMQKAKRQFEYAVKDHKHNIKVEGSKSKGSSSVQAAKKEDYGKLLRQKQSKMQKEVLNAQLKYYYKLRDKKVSYIKHMHKLMERLERERQIDLHKKQENLKKQEKQKIRRKIDQAEHMFQENMKEIKENYQKEKQSNRLKKDQEIKVLSEMERNIEKSKNKEVQLVKTLWEQERMKLDLISKDEERLKHKLQAIYRKNNP